MGVAINTKIDTFTNNGFINSPGSGQWNNGIWISSNATIEKLVNNGTIKGGHSAIMVTSQHIKTVENTGIIHAEGEWGSSILLEYGGFIEHIINTGTISSNNVGIGSAYGVFGTLTIKDGGQVYAKYTAIGVGRSQTLGDLYIDGRSNNGTVSGIYSEEHGILLENNSQTQKIELKNGGIIKGKIDGIRLINSASLSGEMILSGEGSRVEGGRGVGILNRSGKIEGSITIKDGAVVIGGSGAFNVKVENITVDQSNVDLEELNDINNIISGVNQNNIGNIGTNGSGEISLSYDPITGKLTTDFNLNASISGATFRSLISTTSRRSTFIDNVMGNSMQSFALASSSKSQSIAMSEKGNLYADASDYIKSDLNNGSYGSNKEHSLFILPYTSSQNVELSLNEESKGHTKGTIIGYSTLKDSGIYGVYAGYEDTKMGSTYFDINNRTYYAGLKYFNTLFTTEKDQEVYIKAQGKAALIKNDLTKKIGNNEAKAEPNSYAYGVNTALGMNFISNKDIFSPEIGLAYEGGYTEAFSMKDTIGQATVKGGERTYANYLNLFSTKTSLTWFRDWLPNLKTSVELGAKFNINPKVEAEARFGNIKVSDEFDLPRVQKFVSTSFIVPVNEAFYFSLSYNGMFDKDGNTHTGFAQFNYLW